MTRLFLSLYLFIVVTLVVLSALLNHVFFNDESAITDTQVSTQIITLTEMAWTEEDLQLLTSGETLSLYDPELGSQRYKLVGDNQLLEITLAERPVNNKQYMLYSGIFFVVLGVLIALWAWPLWRDLQLLKQATRKIDSQGDLDDIAIESHSLVYPIALALKDLAKKIKELLNTQRELTGAVAHEFRTPLARLKFALATQPEQQSKHWQEMNEDVDELEELVQEMLSYTSIESQQPELNITEIPVFLLCEQRVKLLNGVHDGKLTITVEGAQATVLADAHFAERALDNLLLNASRYAEEKIRVSIEVSAELVTISVEDDGPGIDPINYEKVFQPFFRPDSSRDRKRGGAGLGLAIVKRIMHWHGGSCAVSKSNLGGARFCLYLTNSEV